MVLAFWMVSRLTREIITLENQITKKQMELSNHQEYAGVLGGSSALHMGNIAGLSSSLLPRASLFAQYADQASSMSAMQNLQQQKMMGRVPYLNNQMMQMQYEQSAFMQFKQAAMKALKEQEAATLNKRETELQLELTAMQNDLAKKKKQLESYESLNEQTRERLVPKFS